MKKALLMLLSLSLYPFFGHANYEACRSDLSAQFNVSKEAAGSLCAIDSVFIQQCMNEKRELLSNNNFGDLSDLCIDLLTQSMQEQSNPTQLGGGFGSL